MNRLTICPYKRVPIDELESSNREHIIPDAMGGPNAFSVPADRKMNSDFGSDVDAYLINNFISRSIASRLGVQTRSGPATLTLPGINTATGTPVYAKIQKNSFEFKFTNSSVKDQETGKLIGFVGVNDDAEKALMTANQAREKRGTEAFFAHESQIIDSTFRGCVQVDLKLLARGLLKIGYLTAAYTLGDEFVLSDSGREMFDHFALNVDDVTHLFKTSYEGVDDFLGDLGLLTGVGERHHLVGCLQLHSKLTIFVRLFSCPLLTASYSVENYPPTKSRDIGMFYLIDSLDASIKRTAFGDSDRESRR